MEILSFIFWGLFTLLSIGYLIELSGKGWDNSSNTEFIAGIIITFILAYFLFI